MDNRSPRNWVSRFAWLLILFTIATSGACYWAINSPNSTLLLPARGAEWIRRDEPFSLTERLNDSTFSAFQTRFTSPPHTSTATLHVNALRRLVIVIDGKSLFDSGSKSTSQEQEYSFPIPPAYLDDTEHRLKLMVANRNGPSMVRADCAELNLKTGPAWSASPDQQHWSQARMADDRWEPELSHQFETTWHDVGTLWPLLLVLFLVGAIAGHRAPLPAAVGQWQAIASRVRWVVLLLWAILAINNMPKLPTYVGYDSAAHFRYIEFVAQHLRLPRPTDDWQAFQTPVYYILSAGLYWIEKLMGVSQNALPGMLRIATFTCGAAMVQITFSISRFIFPHRGDLQSITTLVAGLIPVNLYMAQSISNEPLAAVASGILTLLVVRFVSRHKKRNALSVACIGLSVAIAVLSKLTAIIWIVPVITTIALSLKNNGLKPRVILSRITLMLAAALCVAGPYFLHNRIAYGQWFFPNSQVTGVKWWQHPGYRTLSNLFEFGHVFHAPAYSGLASIWDSLYSTLWANGFLSGVIDYQHRPPWNYGLISCSLLLSVVLMAMVTAGIVRLVRPGFNGDSTVRLSALFLLLAILCFIPAVGYVYLTLPIYSCAKGSYMLGTIPGIGILAAFGFEYVSSIRWVRSLLIGLILTWATTAYFSFLIF